MEAIHHVGHWLLGRFLNPFPGRFPGFATILGDEDMPLPTHGLRRAGQDQVGLRGRDKNGASVVAVSPSFASRQDFPPSSLRKTPSP